MKLNRVIIFLLINFYNFCNSKILLKIYIFLLDKDKDLKLILKIFDVKTKTRQNKNRILLIIFFYLTVKIIKFQKILLFQNKTEQTIL